MDNNYEMPHDKCVFFVENYLRHPTWEARRFVMELIAPAIKEAIGKELLPLIDTISEQEKIIEFCNLVPGSWEQHYFQLPKLAEDWLGERVGSGGIAVGYEIPVWMQQFLDKHSIPWVDIRLSPIRFSLDLMFAVRSNYCLINEWLHSAQIPQKMISLYAIQNAAASRMSQRLRTELQINRFHNALVFIGQTASDAALVSVQGKFLTVRDFASELQSMSKGKSAIYYHPHPFSGEHATKELQALADITGQDVKMTGITTDQLLVLGGNIVLTGISSGLLQESEFFGVRSEILHNPVCPLYGKDSYSQYYVNDLMMPDFWKNIFCPKINDFSSSAGIPDRLRYLHNLWFSHADFIVERGPVKNQVEPLSKRLEYLESVWRKISGNWFFFLSLRIVKIFLKLRR